MNKQPTNPISQYPMNNKKGSRKYMGLLLGCVVIVLLACLYWFNKSYIELYYIDMRYNTFKPDDKMYLKTFLVDKSSDKYHGYDLHLYRSIRPVLNTDIDQSKKTYLFECTSAISTDSLCKYRSAFIGKYIKSEIKDVYYKYSNSKGFLIFYVINPEKKALVQVDDDQYNLPNGYVFAENSPLYILDLNVTDKESPTFRSIK